MLTVKHIHPNGCESIHLAREVRYDTGGDGAPCIAHAPTIWIDTPSGETQSIGSWGSFYVMNDAGKTVARYNLGGWSGPKGEMGVVGVPADCIATAGTIGTDDLSRTAFTPDEAARRLAELSKADTRRFAAPGNQGRAA